MTTPIYDFLKGYKRAKKSRFHMPGHKGRGRLCESLDITEIGGADVLYHADGIIAQSEANATQLFDTGHTFYSTEGSTLAIKAMLGIVVRTSEKRTVLAARNVHKAFVYAAGELDLTVTWLNPESTEHLCECNITGEDVRRALNEAESLPAAVYVTSPDYLGNMLDIKGIADVCRGYGVPLLVDNAHGAYLAFCEPSMHPIRLGAAMCADSAHKTLPVLTGGAYLHIAKGHAEYLSVARDTLSMFASTSPSYLTLASLDLCNRELDCGFGKKLAKCKEKVTEIKDLLHSVGQTKTADEYIKVRIDAHRFGYTGGGYSDILRKNGIECEYSDDRYVVLMASPYNKERDYRRLTAVIRSVAEEKRPPIESVAPSLTTDPEAVMRIRDALLSPYEAVRGESAVGRICASPTVSCPPAIPVVVSGERIDADAIKALSYYGIESVNVVK